MLKYFEVSILIKRLFGHNIERITVMTYGSMNTIKELTESESIISEKMLRGYNNNKNSIKIIGVIPLSAEACYANRHIIDVSKK